MEYSQRQIQDQQARLLFRKNVLKLKEVEVTNAIELLTKLLLEKNVSAVHPLRCAEHILSFLELRAAELKQPLIEKLQALVKLMREKLPEGRLDRSQKGETEHVRKNLRDCGLILSSL